MRYDELKQMITGSSARDWIILEDGPLYLDRLRQASVGDRHWTETDSHLYLAVYRADVSLRLAWGMELADGLSFDGWEWPDRAISRFTVDGFWQGALAARWTLLLVDGGRCYLPDPRRMDAGEWATDGEGIAWSAKAGRSPWPGC